MFLVIKKKMIATILCLVIAIIAVFSIVKISTNKANATPYKLTIVLDAGHGGVDGGSTGVSTGITESEINLTYTNKIEKYLKSCGINVVQTRTTLNGLYDYYDKDFKLRDMEKRKEIIKKANPELVISLHMNKFADKSQNGSQVFFGENNKNSENLANAIRDELVKNFDNARELTLYGDYYITECTNKPTVIVECGFLSNKQEELNLINENYQNKMCYSIFCGIMRYLLTNYNYTY